VSTSCQDSRGLNGFVSAAPVTTMVTPSIWLFVQHGSECGLMCCGIVYRRPTTKEVGHQPRRRPTRLEHSAVSSEKQRNIVLASQRPPASSWSTAKAGKHNGACWVLETTYSLKITGNRLASLKVLLALALAS
jgi:hypothetical protein